MASTNNSLQPELRAWMKWAGRIAAPAIIIVSAVFVGIALAAVLTPSPRPTPAITPSDSVQEGAVVLACAAAQRELRKGDLESANEILSAAGIDAENYAEKLSGTCESMWVLTAPEASDADTLWQKAGKQWDSFVKSTFTPLATIGAFLVASWLGLFVLARLLVEAPRIRHLTSERKSRATAASLGWLLLFAVPIGAVIAAAHTTGGLAVLVWLALVVLAGVAVVALAAWLATLRTLRVEVDAAAASTAGKEVSAALITARLRELAGKSTLAEVPTGPAVKDLMSDLKEFSTIAWIAAVQKIVFFLVGVTPWTASVVVRSDSSATLTVVRNRVTLAAETVTTAGPGLEPLSTPPDARATVADYLSVLIAAEILLALRKGYRSELDEVLAGATVGRSVGLQYIAIEWFTTGVDTEAATKLLATAASRDTDNQLVRYSLAHVQYRHTDDPEILVEFGRTLDGWITERAADFGFDDELLRGMTLARAAAARNLAALVVTERLAPPPPPPDSESKEERRARQHREWSDAEHRVQLGADASAALHGAEVALHHLITSATEQGDLADEDRKPFASVAFTAATITRARMVLSSAAPLARTISDLNGALAGARDAAETAGDVAGVKAVDAIRGALEADEFTSDTELAYNAMTELVCWERQRMDSPAVMRMWTAAQRVPLYAEFATMDPELKTAADFPEWKTKRDRAVAAAAAASRAAAAAAKRKNPPT